MKKVLPLNNNNNIIIISSLLFKNWSLFFPYYILFASEMWELLKLTSQILISIIDVIEVLLLLIRCHTG